MSAGGLTVVDGTQLRSLSHPLALPISDGSTVTGAQLLDFAENEASSSLFGLSLPQNLKSTALKHIAGSEDDVTFRIKEFDRDHASRLASDYITAIADELKDDPLVVSVLDGNTLKLFLEDEDDFAMLAENLFTDLDTEDKGKVHFLFILNCDVHILDVLGFLLCLYADQKSPAKKWVLSSMFACKVPGDVREILDQVKLPLGLLEFPQLNDILKKHGAEGEEELGQAQFAELLQQVLQDIADALAEKHIIIIQNIKIINGSKLRMLLADEKQLNGVIEKMLKEKKNLEGDRMSTTIIRGFLEKNWKDIGLPPSEANEAVVLLYDAVFADTDNSKNVVETEDEFREHVKDILEKFAEQLDANPVYHDFEN
ncbi:calcium-binding EF hand family protein [Citrus sinensis]|uniref:Calcium-binding EF hand family protein n=1 Tax=Citrus sinensis TaxID=2711 RepID=A0ACB8KHU1_CITSI|nr:calcium-binding EF hand family protein [Citrus sinensis]